MSGHAEASGAVPQRAKKRRPDDLTVSMSSGVASAAPGGARVTSKTQRYIADDFRQPKKARNAESAKPKTAAKKSGDTSGKKSKKSSGTGARRRAGGAVLQVTTDGFQLIGEDPPEEEARKPSFPAATPHFVHQPESGFNAVPPEVMREAARAGAIVKDNLLYFHRGLVPAKAKAEAAFSLVRSQIDWSHHRRGKFQGVENAFFKDWDHTSKGSMTDNEWSFTMDTFGRAKDMCTLNALNWMLRFSPHSFHITVEMMAQAGIIYEWSLANGKIRQTPVWDGVGPVEISWLRSDFAQNHRLSPGNFNMLSFNTLLQQLKAGMSFSKCVDQIYDKTPEDAELFWANLMKIKDCPYYQRFSLKLVVVDIVSYTDEANRIAEFRAAGNTVGFSGQLRGHHCIVFDLERGMIFDDTLPKIRPLSKEGYFGDKSYSSIRRYGEFGAWILMNDTLRPNIKREDWLRNHLK